MLAWSDSMQNNIMVEKSEEIGVDTVVPLY